MQRGFRAPLLQIMYIYIHPDYNSKRRYRDICVQIALRLIKYEHEENYKYIRFVRHFPLIPTINTKILWKSLKIVLEGIK